MSQSETPLDGQVRCPAGHLCSSTDKYCRKCGAPLFDPDGGDDGE